MLEEHDTIIIGLGVTGISVAHYLRSKKQLFVVWDTREKPSELESFKREFPHVIVYCGPLELEKLTQAKQLIVSPGIAINTREIKAAQDLGVEVIGDIELFVRNVKKSIIAITGSNGKTTVTSMVAKIVKGAGVNVGVGGNIGTPALDLLRYEYDLYVLELSSFQLELVPSLNATVAVNLNVCPDHLDRYENYQEYIAAKKKVYHNAHTAVINLDDPIAWEDISLPSTVFGYTLGKKSVIELPEGRSLDPGILQLNDDSCYDFQVSNMLAAIAIGLAIDLPMQSMLNTLNLFKGLPHRCERIANKNGIIWINDSKATNVGSVISALESIGQKLEGKIILIAGGDAKGADFSPLSALIEEFCKAVILLGKDAKLIADVTPEGIETKNVNDLSDAVITANAFAESGDAVLLSPACASYDMFKNYIERGEIFTEQVNKVINA